MSTKKINAGDTLTVGDLTDDHLGAVIEVGPIDGITSRIVLNSMRPGFAKGRWVYPESSYGVGVFGDDNTPVKVIIPPPVVQPDEPTILGQCIRIEGDTEVGVFVGHGRHFPFLYPPQEWLSWGEVLDRAGDRQIIVSDPPRWPNETPEAPKLIEDDEWPDDDTHLRGWKWIDRDLDSWRWHETDYTGEAGWAFIRGGKRRDAPLGGPWTRGERVK